MLRFDLWETALEENGYSVDELLAGRDPGQELPWDFVDVGVSKKFLLLERKRAYEATTTPDCRVSKCTGCDACDGEAAGEAGGLPLPGNEDSYTVSIDDDRGTPVESQQQYLRYRMIYEKTGKVRFLSHQETLDCIRRALRMSGLPLHYTEGFNPHPRISAGPPLPVGVEGLREYIDVEFVSETHVDIDELNRLLPGGLRVKEVSGPFGRRKGKMPENYVQHYVLVFRTVGAVVDAIANNIDRGGSYDSRWLRLARSLKVWDRMEVSGVEGTGNGAGEMNSKLLAYRSVLAESVLPIADKLTDRLESSGPIDADSFFGAMLKLLIAEGTVVVSRKGKEKDIGLCAVGRVLPGERVEVSINSGANAPTPRELLSALLKERLVPLVRIVRVSTKYETQEGFVDVACLV